MMKSVKTSGPSVKQMASQYAQVTEEKANPGPKPTGNANSAKSVVKPGTVANLKKQYAPLDAASMYKPKVEGEIPRGLEGKQEETKPKTAVEASYMYKDGGAPVTVNPRLPEGKRVVEKEAIRKQYGGEGDPKAPVTVSEQERSDAPEKYQHNYGPLTYLQGAQHLEPEAKGAARPVPAMLKSQVYPSPGQALNELSASKPGAVAFYLPETLTKNGEELLTWDVAMKNAGQNQHLAAASLYQEDQTKLGLAVKQENGEVKRIEVPREWAQKFKTPGDLLNAVSKESGVALDAKRMADASEPYQVRY